MLDHIEFVGDGQFDQRQAHLWRKRFMRACGSIDQHGRVGMPCGIAAIPVATAIAIDDRLRLSPDDSDNLLPCGSVRQSRKEAVGAVSRVKTAGVDQCKRSSPVAQRLRGSMQMPGKRAAGVTKRIGAAVGQEQAYATIPNRILQEEVANRLRQFKRLIPGHKMSSTRDRGDGRMRHKLQKSICIFIRQRTVQPGTDHQHWHIQGGGRRSE